MNQIHKEIISSHSRLIVAQVIKLYFANIPMDGSSHSHHDIIFQSFMLDLYENCRSHRDVRFYASRSGLSLKYFSTVIRLLSGIKPSEMIEMVVAGEAKSMLSDTTRSIKDVALSLNFPDTPTFTKYFRRITGITPKAYRNTLLP